MSELRRDPITGRWVVIAPERLRARDVDAVHLRGGPAGAIDGDMCPFCEGQESIAGPEILAWRPPGSLHNTPGWTVRVVANREPALRVESSLGESSSALFQTLGGLGAHEVIIESPRHDASWSMMGAEEIQRVLWAWRERMRDLRRDFRLRSFVVVKNHGEASGATLDHPHSQLVALPMVPQHLDAALAGARTYHQATTHCVFCDIATQEVATERRMVSSDEQTVAFAPFASRVPFETWIMPRLHRAAFDEETDSSLAAVAERLSDVMRRVNTTLASPAFTLLLHTAPVGEERSAAYHWHLEILPRLGPVNGLAFDGGLYVNPVAPEESARALREAVAERSAVLLH